MKKFFFALGVLALPTASIVAQELQPRLVPVTDDNDLGPGIQPRSTRLNGQDSRDEDILRGVRKAIVSDDSISESGKSIQITVRNGVVVLMGMAKTSDEKNKIESITRSVYGVTNVINKLLVGYIPLTEP